MRTAIPKILIVDDEEIIHESIMDALEGIEQYQFLHAYNGEEALLAFERHEPALMMLDISMPVMTGLQVLKKLHLKAASRCSIIAKSGLASTDVTRNQFVEMGVKLFMEKPLEAEILRACTIYLLKPVPIS